MASIQDLVPVFAHLPIFTTAQYLRMILRWRSGQHLPVALHWHTGRIKLMLVLVSVLLVTCFVWVFGLETVHAVLI